MGWGGPPAALSCEGQVELRTGHQSYRGVARKRNHTERGEGEQEISTNKITDKGKWEQRKKEKADRQTQSTLVTGSDWVNRGHIKMGQIQLVAMLLWDKSSVCNNFLSNS